MSRIRYTSLVSDKLWLPLCILDSVGSIHTKIKLQKLTFLIQYDIKKIIYDFETNHFGPYSELLNLDTISWPTLIKFKIQRATEYSNQYYIFEITNMGRELLTELIQTKSKSLVGKVKISSEKYNKLSYCSLMENVYSKFGIKNEDSEALFKTVKQELNDVMPIFIQSFKTYKNKYFVYLLSNLEIIELLLKELNNLSDTTKKGVALNLSHELIEKSSYLLKDLIPPINSDSLSSRFIEIAEIESFLREYCDTNGILKDPLNEPIEKILSEDDAKRMSKTLSKVQII